MVTRADLRIRICTTDVENLVDGLFTLITWTLHDGEGGGGGIDRTEKAAKPFDLFDFGRGKIFPYVVFPDKELCMQTAIVK